MHKMHNQDGATNPAWKGGRDPKTYRKNLQSICERCGSTRFLLIHHKDENRSNNEPGNLETLCKRCHQLHHGCVSNLPNPTG
jgi:HNH endonuclease